MKMIERIIRYFDLYSDPNAKINYVEGDATRPIGMGRKLIVHCCNDIGAWGAGFVLALSKRDSHPENMYREWSLSRPDHHYFPQFALGEIQIVPFAEPMIEVCNLIGQHKTGRDENGNPPVRYEAIRKGLKKVRKYCRKHNVSVHAPKFGAELAGGDWNIIEKIIEEELTTRGVYVTVYLWK